MKFELQIIITIFLGACIPIPVPTPISTETATPAPTLTPTVIWFPPTATHTAIPTLGLTQTSLSHIPTGQVLLQDNFRDISLWITGNPGNGTVALGIDELSLVITQPKSYLFSFRNEPIFSDFYLELTANPSLCAGLDEYGILFRYNSPADFYRYSLSCDGKTRLDKVVNGTAYSPQPWLESISVPRAVPTSLRMGVWVSGSEMQFYIDEGYQFTVTDRSLNDGLIGVFIRSTAENAVTVSFSDLVVYQVDP